MGLFHQAVCKLRGTTEVFALMDIPDRWKTSAAENQRKGLDRDGFSGYLQSLNAMIRNLMIMNQFPHFFYGQFDKICWYVPYVQTNNDKHNYPCQMVGATPLSKLRCCLNPRKFRHIQHASQGSK